MSALQYVRSALASFDDGPAVTDYQRGYQEALRDVLHEAFGPLDRAAPSLLRELKHLVCLLEPLERDGRLNVPGLATLNGARAAIAKASGGAA